MSPQNSMNDYEHLDSFACSSLIQKSFKGYADLLDQNNPNTYCENYLKEKVSRLQGILLVLKDRKNYIKSYDNKQQTLKIKAEKLNTA